MDWFGKLWNWKKNADALNAARAEIDAARFRKSNANISSAFFLARMHFVDSFSFILSL